MDVGIILNMSSPIAKIIAKKSCKGRTKSRNHMEKLYAHILSSAIHVHFQPLHKEVSEGI